VRKPFGRKILDARYGNNHLDAHFLDAMEGDEAEAVKAILELHANQQLGLLIPYSVKDEIEHENTPDHVKERAQQLSYTSPVDLTEPERELRKEACALMRGNAKPGSHDADAYHLVEAAKHGGRYFITNDKRVLKRQEDISALLGIKVVTPTKFLETYNECAGKP